MSQVYDAHFHDVEFVHQGKKKSGEAFSKNVRVLAPSLKSVCLALADHANDEGEGAYPSITKLEDKTELSRVSVIACLTAMKQEGIIFFAGMSKRETCNYTIMKEKLVEMAGWERQKREKSAGKASLPSKATLPVVVKPLYSPSKATLPESSFNHPLTTPLGASAPEQRGQINPNTGNRTDAKVKGDGMDFIFASAMAAQGKEVESRVQEYPPDVQGTLTWMIEIWHWPLAAVPAKPIKGGKGGEFAQWIHELRDINRLIAGFGKEALLAVVKPCEKLSISHPAAITWALPGEVGKLSAKAAKTTEKKPWTGVVDTPFGREIARLESMTPEEREAERKRNIEATRKAKEEARAKLAAQGLSSEFLNS